MATIRRRNGKWQVQVRRLGTASLSKTFHSKKDAQSWAWQMEVQADRQELPKDPKQLDRLTLAELVIRYRDLVTPTKRGQDVERVVLNAFLRHSICTRTVKKLTSSNFATYRDERLQSVKPHTLKREFSTLHNLFQIARDEWNLPIKENPVSKVRIECESNRRERRLRDGELQRLIDAARQTRNPYILPIIFIATETGLRRSEILGACWSHLDLEKRLWSVPRAKNGHSRSISLTLKAVEVLRDLMSTRTRPERQEDRIFPITANALKLAWVRLRERAGLEDFHFHDFRHEAISRFFEYGLSTPEVALLSGHRDPRMLFRYSHPTQLRIQKLMDRREEL